MSTHQPLELPNDLSLRSFIAECETSNRYGYDEYRCQREQRVKSQSSTESRSVVVKPCGTCLGEQVRQCPRKTHRRFLVIRQWLPFGIAFLESRDSRQPVHVDDAVPRRNDGKPSRSAISRVARTNESLQAHLKEVVLAPRLNASKASALSSAPGPVRESVYRAAATVSRPIDSMPRLSGTDKLTKIAHISFCFSGSSKSAHTLASKRAVYCLGDRVAKTC